MQIRKMWKILWVGAGIYLAFMTVLWLLASLFVFLGNQAFKEMTEKDGFPPDPMPVLTDYYAWPMNLSKVLVIRH
jgi:hypothetical protein